MHHLSVRHSLSKGRGEGEGNLAQPVRSVRFDSLAISSVSLSNTGSAHRPTYLFMIWWGRPALLVLPGASSHGAWENLGLTRMAHGAQRKPFCFFFFVFFFLHAKPVTDATKSHLEAPLQHLDRMANTSRGAVPRSCQV